MDLLKRAFSDPTEALAKELRPKASEASDVSVTRSAAHQEELKSCYLGRDLDH